MKKLDIETLYTIDGGWSISGTLINSFSTIIKTVHSIGQSLGSSLRRVSSNNLCKL